MKQPQKNIPLSDHSTMRLGGNATYLLEVTSPEEVLDAIAWAKPKSLPLITIGSGSNIVWGDKGFHGLVLVNKIAGFQITPTDETSAEVTIGAGENWDGAVKRTVEQGYTGIAELSMIPGTAGATPVQNVGAYGREISETLQRVNAIDKENGKLVTFSNKDCKFSYRTSRFKTQDHGKYIITSITLRLTRENPKPPYYDALQTYFDKHDISLVTPQEVRDAVIAIRSKKLPDPAQVANNGSFFKNPIVAPGKAEQLRDVYPEMVSWPTEDGNIKLSAAWLIDQAGFKDIHDKTTGMATWPAQPLVLINEHAKSTQDLLSFKQQIVDAVQAKFGVELEQEPEFIEL